MFLGILEVVRSIFVVGQNNYVTIITFYCFGSLVELTEVTYCIFGDIAEVLGSSESLQNFNKFVKLEQMKVMVKMNYLIAVHMKHRRTYV